MPTFDPEMYQWKKNAAGTVLAPVGRMSYPNLFVPRSMPGDSSDKEPKYSVSVMLPKSVNAKQGLELVKETAVAKWGPDLSKFKIRSPILNHADKNADADLVKEFPYLIRCASTYKPDVLFASGEPCQTPEEVYAGRWAWVSIRPFAWDGPLFGKGISFGLSNIVLLDHDDRIGGGRAKVSDEFGKFFEKQQAAGAGGATRKAPEKAAAKDDDLENIFS